MKLQEKEMCAYLKDNYEGFERLIIRSQNMPEKRQQLQWLYRKQWAYETYYGAEKKASDYLASLLSAPYEDLKSRCEAKMIQHLYFPEDGYVDETIRRWLGSISAEGERCANIYRFLALNDDHLVSNLFYNVCLSMQLSTGAFLEKGGHDTSYQAVTLQNLLYLKGEITQEIRDGFDWLYARTAKGGSVFDTGNTRTAWDINNSPERKQPNVREIAYLFYTMSWLDANSHYAARAKAIVNKYL